MSRGGHLLLADLARQQLGSEVAQRCLATQCLGSLAMLDRLKPHLTAAGAVPLLCQVGLASAQQISDM